MKSGLLTPGRVLVLLWIGLPVLAIGLYSLRGSMHETWRAEPPTAEEETDCRIDAMMGGDNPVEVERTRRACLQAANDAYVRPRLRRTTLLFGLVVLAYAGVAAAVTRRRLGAAGTTPGPS